MQRQLQVKLLPHGGVHDAAREDVREAAVVARAPGKQMDRDKGVKYQRQTLKNTRSTGKELANTFGKERN